MPPRVLPVVLLALLLETGCTATVTALKYRDLDVQTRLAAPIFLDPVPVTQRTVWLDVRSTADQPLDLSALRAALAAKGYAVRSDPDQVQYRLQVHVLYVGKTSQAALEQTLGAGFGGPLAGVVTGATAGAVLGGSGHAVGIGAGLGGLLGAAAETVSGALVQAVTYTVITDAQLAERSPTPVRQQQTATLPQGTQTHVRQDVTDTSGWKQYRTRLAASATQVNLRVAEARAALAQGIVRSLAGLL